MIEKRPYESKKLVGGAAATSAIVALLVAGKLPLPEPITEHYSALVMACVALPMLVQVITQGVQDCIKTYFTEKQKKR